MKEKNYFGTIELSRLFDVSTTTVINWINCGELEAHRPPCGRTKNGGTVRRVPRESALKFAANFPAKIRREVEIACGVNLVVYVADANPFVALDNILTDIPSAVLFDTMSGALYDYRRLAAWLKSRRKYTPKLAVLLGEDAVDPAHVKPFDLVFRYPMDVATAVAELEKGL